MTSSSYSESPVSAQAQSAFFSSPQQQQFQQVQVQSQPVQNQQQQQQHSKQTTQTSLTTHQQSHSISSQNDGGELRVDLRSAQEPSGFNATNIQQLKQQLAADTISQGQNSPSAFTATGMSHGGSVSSLQDTLDLNHRPPKFVSDTSKYWYKANISREDAINLLKDKVPGTFVIRDSNSFPGAFGLAIKVAQLPPNVQTKPGTDPSSELVRHFLIESTTKGVRLKGCQNEPAFGSLSALVYQHSITPLALPCKLVLPEPDQIDGSNSPKIDSPNSAQALLTQGAACNVLYLNSVDTELLTGPQAVSKAMFETLSMQPQPRTTEVHFKVSSQGVTLTDNQRKLFFRRHYPVNTVTFCGLDPEDRRWSRENEETGAKVLATVFGFVARKQGSQTENMCHLFAELDPDQPASAIVNFVTKVMIGLGSKPNKS